MNLKLSTAIFVATLILSSCAEKKVAEQKSTDTSHNYFTGSNTVSTDKDATYKNRKTGAVSNKNTHNEVTYDKNGKKISDTSDTETK